MDAGVTMLVQAVPLARHACLAATSIEAGRRFGEAVGGAALLATAADDDGVAGSVAGFVEDWENGGGFSDGLGRRGGGKRC